MNKSLATKIALVAAVSLMAAGCSKSTTTSPTSQSTDTSMDQSMASPTPTPSDTMASPTPTVADANTGTTTGTAKTFTVTGQNFSFSPNNITVNKGDKVTIVFKNADGFHNLMIDEFNVKTKTIKTGESDTVSFTADKTGSFEYYCSIGNHKAMGMYGTMTVK